MNDLFTLKHGVAQITDLEKFREASRNCHLETEQSDTLWWATPKLIHLADEIGYKVEYGDPLSSLSPFEREMVDDQGEGECHGLCNRKSKVITIDPNGGQDFKTRTLIHELAHALGAFREDLATDEITAESVAYLVCKQMNYDTTEFAVPYTAPHYWLDGGMFLDWQIEKLTNRIASSLAKE